MGKGIPKVEGTGPQGVTPEHGDHPAPCRRPAGRKPGPAPDGKDFGSELKTLLAHCFPDLNAWFDLLPDLRRQDMCVYTGSHIWWQMLLTFLLRGGSRNAFDADRNSGVLPDNVLDLCGQVWDLDRLGERKTVTCSQNVRHHAARVDSSAVARIGLRMVRRLMAMRLLDTGRLMGRWWQIAVDGTVKDRGRRTQGHVARYRYALTAALIGPFGLTLPMMTEFIDMRDPVRDKEDCELNAFLRLAPRLKMEFPALPICLLLDGLYATKPIFDVCDRYQWKIIASLREGRQPTGYDEAVQTMLMSPGNVLRGQRKGEDGLVNQTLRWTHDVEFGHHKLHVLFSGEIAPHAATLWVWVTNIPLTTATVYAVANHGGRLRQNIENLFNVEKNGGFGLEHTFCVHEQASKNYHLIMQVAAILWQLLAKGVLHRLTRACRKLTDVKLVDLLYHSLQFVLIDPKPRFAQLRFISSA